MSDLWWVNQSHSGEFSVVWAPKRNERGNTRDHWDRLQEAQVGDYLIHYAGMHVRGVSQVLASAHDAENPFPGAGAWATEGRMLAVDFEAFADPLPRDEIPHELRKPVPGGPFDKNHQVKQGYFFCSPPATTKWILEAFGLRCEETSTSTTGKIEINGETDKQAMTTVRTEQSRVRAYLLNDRPSAPCGICGVDLPAEYLVGAHIKQRAHATNAERRAFGAIAMLACVLGCDAAFERRHLYVGDDGKIRLSRSVPRSIRSIFQQLEGKKAPAFNGETKKSFAWHRARALGA